MKTPAMPDKRIAVNAYSGSRAEELPRSFIIHDETIEVVSVHSQWLEEEVTGRMRRRFFKVQGDDGHLHTVYYDEAEKAWFLGKTR